MIVGYTDKLSARPGQRVACFVDSGGEPFEAQFVRMTGHLDSVRGAVYTPVASDIDGSYPGIAQQTHTGSFAATEAVVWPFRQTFSVTITAQPTTVCEPRAIVSIVRMDDQLSLLDVWVDQTCLSASVNQLYHATTGRNVLTAHKWTTLTVTLERSGALYVQIDNDRHELLTPDPQRAHEIREIFAEGTTTRVTWGKSSDPTVGCFDGKLARPQIYSTTASDVWEWDFGQASSGNTILGANPASPTLTLTNSPLRAVTGPDWDGRFDHPALAPNHYDACYFHSDDMTDVRWRDPLCITIPTDAASGVYAIRVATSQETDLIPFVVTPNQTSSPRSRVALVLPTWTYLAYGNWRTYSEDTDARATYFGEVRPPNTTDELLEQHPEFGRCFYDVNNDGSPVTHSSFLRPLLNMRPTYTAGHANGYRHFSSDLRILAWLADRSVSVAVLTDHDLHDQGASALLGFDVILTGGHPEYCSWEILDAYDEYIEQGGNLMYLGGNGFYWVTTARAGEPHVLEMRRGHNGIRRWDTPPGEEHLSSGELGGLWRYRGRPPHALVGVGTTAQGFDSATGYKRTEAGESAAFSWVFEGIPPGPIGLGEGPLGGAAGDEIDCADTCLGTPVGTVRLASSGPHSSRYLLSVENIPHLLPDTEYDGRHSSVRADIVLVPRGDRYAVFSTGSIAWTNAMTDVPDGQASRVTENVLRRMLEGDIPTQPGFGDQCEHLSC